jgi:glycosyltransferase involved in cell wall biosynthesis
MLLFTFNIGVDDGSGLPTYSESFMRNYKDKGISVINIIYDRHQDYRIEEREWQGKIWINCYLPRFLESFYADLPNLIIDVIERDNITMIIEPDYLMENYLEKCGLKQRGIKKILFVHLLYRGLMDCFTKEPYFQSHISTGMDYLATIAFLEWKAVMTCDTIICNSQFTRDQVERFYYDCNLQDKEIITAPLGIDVESVPYLPATDSGKWAYFGRLETQKGMVWLEKDFKLNPDSYLANPLLVCGAGSQDGKYMAAHMFDGFVDYRGNLKKEELWLVLCNVKYCIFPSIYEPWGLALTEALAMGKICIISHKASGMLEQVEHMDNGLIFNFQKRSIVKYIELLEGSDIDFDKMAARARQTSRTEKVHFEIIDNIFLKG